MLLTQGLPGSRRQSSRTIMVFLTWPRPVYSSGTCWWRTRRKLWSPGWSQCPSAGRWSSAGAASVWVLCWAVRWSEGGRAPRWSGSQCPASDKHTGCRRRNTRVKYRYLRNLLKYSDKVLVLSYFIPFVANWNIDTWLKWLITINSLQSHN